MGWLDSDAIAMYPSQGRSDYYNRKARYVSEANVTVSAGALTSKHGFVINGLVPSKVDAGSQLSAGSFWIRGYVFTVTRDISISETGSNAGDVLCAVLRTDENGQRVGIADRIINQNDSTYELDADDGSDGSAFYGIQIVTKTQAEWNELAPQHEECRYKIVSGTSGDYTEFYLRLALWNNGAWEQPKNENVALNGLKIDASAISVTMAETQAGALKQEKYTATQDLATLLNKNFIVDDGVTGDNGHIRIRELTTDNLSTVLVDRQPAIVKKSNATYLFVGDGESALSSSAMQPITVRTVEGWTDDEGGLTTTTATHYKISGDKKNNGLKIACGSSLYALFAGDTVTINGELSVSKTTTLTGALTASGGITASKLTVNGATTTSSLSVTGATTLTGALTANGGITASALTVNGATKTSSLSVTGATTLTGALTANGGITASSVSTSGDISCGGNISCDKNVTGKIGTISVVSEWNDIASTDTIATGFAKTNYAINDLRTRMTSAETKIDALGSQTTGVTSKSDFGGTGRAVNSLNSLISVLDDIFRGNETVLGMIMSANGFYATGGV